MIKSRYFSEPELQRIVSAAEQDVELAERAKFEEQRLQAVQQWAADPQNAQQLAHIRAEFDRLAPQRRPAQAPQRPATTELPRIGFHNRLRDPYVR